MGCFGLHRWGKWSEPMARASWAGSTAFQRRECLSCGKAQQRKIGDAVDADLPTKGGKGK